jgi:3-phenylpropionate/trans-cinnamate dioxygenase ferredoxin reductase subunit
MSADTAVGGIRQLDGEGSIELIGEEPYPPYDRAPLSKGLWRGDFAENIWRNTGAGSSSIHRSRDLFGTDQEREYPGRTPGHPAKPFRRR